MCIIDRNPCAPSIHPAVPHERVPHEASYNHVALHPFTFDLCVPGFPGRVVVVNTSERQRVMPYGLSLHHLMSRKYSVRIRKPATSAQPARGAEQGPF